MKKLFIIVLIVAFFIFLAAVFINPAIIFAAKKQLATVFTGSEVTIASCRLNPAKQLSLFEIRIKNKQAYDFLIKEARMEYSLSSIINRRMLKFCLQDAQIIVNLPQKNITAFSQYLNLGSPGGAFMVNSLELSNGSLHIKAKDLNVSGVLSSQVSLSENIMEYLDVNIDSLMIQDFNANGILLKTAQGSPAGRFGMRQIKYNKLTISEIKSEVKLSGKEMFLENVYAKAFDGIIGGNLTLKMDQEFKGGAALHIANIDIARFISDFELKEKFEMTGRLSGDLAFQGKGAAIEILSGNLSSLGSGGTLIIKDTRFLENMARDANQSVDLLMESFKDYHYTIGNIKLFLENGNLNLDIALDGETGKRNISIVLHDFLLKKEVL